MKPQIDCARYESLVEQTLLEDQPLSDEEQQLLSAHARHCEACGPEAALWDRLSQVRRACGAQPSAPPASGPAMERLLGRVQERHHSVRRQRLAWMVAPAAAAAVLLGVLFVMQRAGTSSSPNPTAEPTPKGVTAHLGLVSGAVQVAGMPALAGRRLHPGEPLSTADGLAVVTFDDTTRFVLEPHSTITLRADSRARVQLHLARGAATFQVARRTARHRFEVASRWARVEVLGTLFQVASRPRAAQVAVARGRVRVVRRTGKAVILSAGQQLARSGAPHALTDAQRAHLLQRLALASRLPTHAGGVLAVRSKPTVATLRLDGRRLGVTPLSVCVVPGDYTLNLSAPGHGSHGEELRVRGSERVDVRRTLRPLLGAVTPPRGPDGVQRLLPTRPTGPSMKSRPPEPQQPRPAATVATLLQQIRARRARGDWRGAVTGYQTLRRLHPAAPEARTCLVLMGQVQLRHLGRTRAALRSFERYLRQGGSLAPEAAWGRIQALGRLGLGTAEAKACRAFLKRYPRALYTPQVKKRLRKLAAPQIK